MEEGKKVFRIVSDFSSPDCSYETNSWEETYKAVSLEDAFDMNDEDMERRFGDRTFVHKMRAYEIKEINGKREKSLVSSYGL